MQKLRSCFLCYLLGLFNRWPNTSSSSTALTVSAIVDHQKKSLISNNERLNRKLKSFLIVVRVSFNHAYL